MLNFESKTLLPCFGPILPSRSCEINQRLFIPNSATADPSNDRQKFVSPSMYTGTRHRPESNQSFSPPLSNTQRNRGTRKQLGGNPRARRPEFIIKKRRAGAERPFHLPFGSWCINIQAAMRLFVSRQCQVVYFIFHNTLPSIQPPLPARL